MQYLCSASELKSNLVLNRYYHILLHLFTACMPPEISDGVSWGWVVGGMTSWCNKTAHQPKCSPAL